MLGGATKAKLIKRASCSPISAVDLFCGAGGLTHGLLQAGINVEAGIDIDKNAEYAFKANNDALDKTSQRVIDTLACIGSGGVDLGFWKRLGPGFDPR